MCYLSPEVLARLRFLPISGYDMQAAELKTYLLETVQMIDRQESEKLCSSRGNRSPNLGQNLGKSNREMHEIRLPQAIQQHD